ncbi:MAG: ATP-binding protein, partial [Bacteroidales bacterium]|nr:ATP-binding protein [Bacteroidales bacterium]
IRYDYEVSFTPDVILREELLYFPNGHKSVIYDRKFVGGNEAASIIFGQSLKLTSKEKTSLIDNTLNNHTVLSTLGKLNPMAQPTALRNLYKWIEAHVHQVDGDERDFSLVKYLKDIREDARSYAFFKQMLDKADVNILGFEVREQVREISPQMRKKIENDPTLSEPLKMQLLSEKIEDIIFTHSSSSGEFEIPLSEQSAGTLSFLGELKFLYRLINGSHVYMLDEIEQNLHYELLVFYLIFFLTNSEQSQLIFTSQELQLLDEDFIDENRYTVWFVEKDSDTASSLYQRADSFGIHKNLSLYKAYRAGRIGCRPMLKSTLIES